MSIFSYIYIFLLEANISDKDGIFKSLEIEYIEVCNLVL